MKEKTKIGALWLNEKGNYTGNIELNGQKIKITLTKNQYKKEDKHPDLVIFSNDKQETEYFTPQDFEPKKQEHISEYDPFADFGKELTLEYDFEYLD